MLPVGCTAALAKDGACDDQLLDCFAVSDEVSTLALGLEAPGLMVACGCRLAGRGAAVGPDSFEAG